MKPNESRGPAWGLLEEYEPFTGTREYRACDEATRRTLISICVSAELVDRELLEFVEDWLARKLPARRTLSLVRGGCS